MLNKFVFAFSSNRDAYLWQILQTTILYYTFSIEIMCFWKKKHVKATKRQKIIAKELKDGQILFSFTFNLKVIVQI